MTGSFDLIVVGGGPAGLAAGIQASHVGLRTLILEKNAFGGRLRMARRVDNLPGHPQGPSGLQVVDRIVAQAMGRGAILVRDEVSRVDYQDPAFTITGGDGIYWSRAVILAVGLAPRPIDIPGTRAAGDRLVSYWLDLPDVNGRRVAVIGGGEVALDQAGSIAQKGGRVAVLVRSSRPRAFPGLVRDIQALGVDVKTRAPVRRMDRTSGGLALIVGSETDPWIMETDFVVASIGAGPALVPVTPEAEARAGRGLFRAGDLIDPQYRQAAIAGGDGLKKAMMVQEYLEAEEAKWTS